MSKAKETIEELRAKLFDRKKQETIEQAHQTINETLDNTVYDVIQDPKTNSRSFFIVKIKYDIETKQAIVVDIQPFQDKAAGLTITMDKENLKYLYEKNRRGK